MPLKENLQQKNDEAIFELFKKKKRLTESELKKATGATAKAIDESIENLLSRGVLLCYRNDAWVLDKEPAVGANNDFVFVSDKDGNYKFGFYSDQHICSKYARLDVGEDLFDKFAKSGVKHVLNAGNWIDGEARFNKHDLLVHGCENQCRELADKYPKRKGIVTYAVTGDDHEGWYNQQLGIDVGSYAAGIMKEEGRNDWVNLGYMECFITLRHAESGKECKVSVMHPGGGSAYAVSYKPQKIAECVPLESTILTRSGWKTHDQLIVGEEVLGYNIETDACEWTEVTAVNEYEDREVLRYGNKHWNFECTENHRWAIEHESRCGANYKSPYPSQRKRRSIRSRMMSTIAESNFRSRIIQSAAAPDGPGFSASDRADWIMRGDAVKNVLLMTSDQRKSFILGMMYGEGTLADMKNGSYSLSFSQNPGPVRESFALACFLEGISTSIPNRNAKLHNGENRVNTKTTLLSKRMRIIEKSKILGSRTCDVWCPTTKLGTWVMNQNGVITITGNSFSGGDKPAAMFIGHYHKMSYNYTRGIHAIQCGTGEDQTPFMRKKGIDAHVGGGVVEFGQDPKTGALISCKPEFFPYFVKGYYNNRWSHSGKVTHAKRM